MDVGRRHFGRRRATRVFWVNNFKCKNHAARCLHFQFEFAEGQNTKIWSKYHNAQEAQNAKISAVSTPILTGKAAFFRIFALSQKNQWKTAENSRKRKNPSHQKSENFKKVKIFDVFWYFSAFWKFGILLLVVFCIFVLKF